ncbi:uncharacterized protein LOC144438645 isoform X2 [Glandiceps talaboti]
MGIIDFDSDTEEKLEPETKDSEEKNQKHQFPRAQVFRGRYRYQRDVLRPNMATAVTTQRISSIEVDNPAPKTSDEEDAEPVEYVARKRRFKTPKLKSIRKIFKWKTRKSKSLGEAELESSLNQPLSKSTSELPQIDVTHKEDDNKLKVPSSIGTSGLSMSHDSVFNPDQQKAGQSALTQPKTTSFENIPAGFASELSAKLKLKVRIESSSDDDGIGHTADVTLTTADVVNENPEPKTSGDNKRDSGILSMDDEVFVTKRQPITRRTKSLNSSPTSDRKRKMFGYKKSKSTANAGDLDFDSVVSKHKLSNEAALYKRSIAPKTRRASSRSRLISQRSGSRSELPNTPEEELDEPVPNVNLLTVPNVIAVTLDTTVTEDSTESQEFTTEVVVQNEVAPPVAETKEPEIEPPKSLVIPKEELTVIKLEERKLSVPEKPKEMSAEVKTNSLTDLEKLEIEQATTTFKITEHRSRSASFEPKELGLRTEKLELRTRSATLEKPSGTFLHIENKDKLSVYTEETSKLVSVEEHKLKIEKIEPLKEQTREVIIVSAIDSPNDTKQDEAQRKREGFRASRKKAAIETAEAGKDNDENKDKSSASTPSIILSSPREADKEKSRVKIRAFSEREHESGQLKIRTFSERRASEESGVGVPSWVAMAKQRQKNREDDDGKETDKEKETEKDEPKEEKKEVEKDPVTNKQTVSITVASRRQVFNRESTQEQQKNEINKKPTSSIKKTFVAPKTEKCIICERQVYLAEMAKAEGKVFHKYCQKCKVCNRTLMISNLMLVQNAIYCRPHGSEIKNKHVELKSQSEQL